MFLTNTIISLISDLIILLFDLTLYTHLTLLKKENRLYKGLMYSGIVLITAAYILAAYAFHVPYTIASFICMTVPSFLLFLCLSRYKNARFLVTFCFVDTVTLIIAACGKFVLIMGGTTGGLISCIVMLILSIGTYFILRPYFPKYRKLMEQVSKGWAPMAVSTVFIYILLVAAAAYPSPIITRLQYVPFYILMCITILSFYAVFIVMLVQKAKLTSANTLLQQQQHWHDLAYLDELTQLANPAAYKARIDEIQKLSPPDKTYAIMIFDIDNFKNVNDTYGHHYGNEVLKKTADFFLAHFPGENYEFFRIGGDEFSAIVSGLSEKQIQDQAAKINAMPVSGDYVCTCSCGYALVDFSAANAFQEAFIEADQAMYTI